MTTIGQLLTDCTAIAKEAGRVQLEYFRSGNLNIQAKFNEADVVTAADKASEKLILEEIRRLYPTHSILSEESGADLNLGEYRWVIDPLDGTTNFSNGLPNFCVSIGIQHKGETIVGVVYAPYLGELFTAAKGMGAFLNGQRIHASSKTALAQAVVATGFPVDKDRTPDCNIDNVARVLPRIRGLRRPGAAAIDICYVAAGFLDGYWEINIHEWDVCAGLLIAAEAGAEHRFFREDRNVSVVVAPDGIMPLLAPLLASEPCTLDPFGQYNHK